MSKLTISEVAERHLDQWADAVQRGELSIWQLPLAVQQFISIGWAEGMAYAAEQAREYERQLDRAYLAAYSPKDRREEYQRRLDEYFQTEDEQFFSDSGRTAWKEAA
ncbi:hypothetical protein [Leucobacter ruminantium]|uniref:Uncharacterized protein n=1 Tax=Leucobacter ruminantium TaxID=1289170 RepID=A0A939M0W6_9MICO|nr:hypothetical protein [Leucobacter ruminantium]MBO1805967.1 hypothetical protein [Leucobacter ruminantium]